MGRHSAGHASLPLRLRTAALRGAHVASRLVPHRRSALGVGAAAAAFALTAGTTATAFAGGSTASGTSAPAAASTPTTTTTTPVTADAGTTTADAATVEAASDVLVRAEFVTGEGAAALTPDQSAQIEDARARLNEAVAAAAETRTTPALDGLALLSTESTADDGTGLLDAAGSSEADLSEETDDTGTDLLASTALGSSTTSLAERTTDRASRSSGRTSLDLSATVPELTEASVGAEADSPDEATTPAEEAAASTTTDADEATEAEGATPAVDEAAATAETAETAGTGESTSAEPAPTTEEIATLTAELSTLLDAAGSGVAVEVVPGPPSAEEVAVQLDQWAAMTAGYGNGEIPSSALCELSFAPGEQLRCDAAYQIEALNVKYRETFGTDLSVTDSYRSYASQVAVKASRGYFAAPPGLSNHGWALALDLGGGIQSYGTAQYEWMRANAPAFGFDNPEWARAGGSKNEPWHWEYGDIS